MVRPVSSLIICAASAGRTTGINTSAKKKAPEKNRRQRPIISPHSLRRAVTTSPSLTGRMIPDTILSPQDRKAESQLPRVIPLGWFPSLLQRYHSVRARLDRFQNLPLTCHWEGPPMPLPAQLLSSLTQVHLSFPENQASLARLLKDDLIASRE